MAMSGTAPALRRARPLGHPPAAGEATTRELPAPRRITPRRTAIPVRAGRRPRAAVVLLAAILTGFLLGLTYLAQTMHAAATGYEMERLLAERDRLTQQLRSVEGSVVQWGAEPLVIEQAQQRGLNHLGDPLRLPAR